MSQAIKDLERYALKHGLHLFRGHDECALQMDVDPNDLREMVGEMNAIACFPDHTVFQVCAFVANGILCRFGLESEGGDVAGAVVATTLEQLEEMGDPQDWEN